MSLGTRLRGPRSTDMQRNDAVDVHNLNDAQSPWKNIEDLKRPICSFHKNSRFNQIRMLSLVPRKRNKREIIYIKQFGFRSNHSAMHAILSTVDKIHMGIEKGMFSCGIFLDFSKAFNTVEYSILIKKLKHYGIRGIAKEWFTSYLSNRKQFTSVANISSVTQGSIFFFLPLLFYYILNDFSHCFKSLDLHLFANDSNLFFCHNNRGNLKSIINTELS